VASRASARTRALHGLEGFSAVPKETRAEFLAAKFRAGRAEDWIERLRAADLGAALCENIETIRARSSRQADGTPGTDRGSYSFSVYPDHPSGHEVTQLDPYAVRPARGGVRALPPAEKYGASTRQVLIELGYSEGEIAALIEDGAISESWSREYLPS
jgi:crotonobetainyl-CoA:carnitine CoA-transferase CaiB-like acyl-CoA transferase